MGESGNAPSSGRFWQVHFSENIAISQNTIPGFWAKKSYALPIMRGVYKLRVTRINTAFVESTINQVVSRRFAKLQQMHWTPGGTHLLLQTRTPVLNSEFEGLSETVPLFRDQAQAAAA